MNKFEGLGLSEQALASLKQVGFTDPTEIQSKAIGIVAQGKDLIASAQTGSGKTVAYALPILDILRLAEKSAKAKTRALVIVPTRELALQVRDEFERFAGKSGIKAVALFGGTGYRKQVQELHRGADIIVATPGRLLDCLNRNFASLSKLQVLVLDEADRLLDMGFMPQVQAVIARAPEKRQTLLFSATIDERIKKIAQAILREPQVVAANRQKIEPASIEQQFHYIKESQKEDKLLELLMTVQDGSVLVFTRTKRKAATLTVRLKELEIGAEEIHGDISQAQRGRTLNRFRCGDFNVLVATDVAARGLDVPAISHVINYDLPVLAEDYVHRIGRTGRAGRSGIAHSFVSNSERRLVQEIHQVLKNECRTEDRVDDSDGSRDGVRSEMSQRRSPGRFQRSSRQAVEYAERLAAGNRQTGKKTRGARVEGARMEGARTQYGRAQGGSMQSGRTQDGRTQYGRTQDGRTQDGRTQDGRTQGRRTQDGRTHAANTQGGRTYSGSSHETYSGKFEDGEAQQSKPQTSKPQYGKSQYGKPQHGKPQYGKPQYGKPQDGKAQHGKPQHGKPQDSTSQYGKPQHGKPQHSKAQHGKPQQGRAKSRRLHGKKFAVR